MNTYKELNPEKFLNISLALFNQKNESSIKDESKPRKRKNQSRRNLNNLLRITFWKQNFKSAIASNRLKNS
ncbi:hypothetical protein [Planococcus sp. MB-3u-03]|uniref:hypothetical protein n=1 Tax=Planococcus sp. MB-3u-03 TaxID=2058136 RepID=UPI003FA6B09D